MTQSKLFSPITVGRCQLSHRVVMAPLTRYRADDQHVHSKIAAEYYAQRAEEPGTLLISEATFIAEEAGGYPNIPGLYNRGQIEAWKRVTDAVHGRGSYICAQLWALGRAADPTVLEKEGGHPYVSSWNLRIPERADRPMHREKGPNPKPLTVEEIKKYIGHYVQAAKNAVEAGFDLIEIHGANGYLPDQFLQNNCNQRPPSDPYTGSKVEGRTRFHLEIVNAVCAAIGADRVGLRLSPFSPFQGMKMKDSDVHETFSALVKQLPPDMAYLHLVESRIAGNADVESGEKIDFLVSLAKMPVIIAGGFKRQSAIDAAEAHNAAIAFGRLYISNPDIVRRLREDIELTPYDRKTFYTRGPEATKGYIDYPRASTQAESKL